MFIIIEGEGESILPALSAHCSQTMTSYQQQPDLVLWMGWIGSHLRLHSNRANIILGL